MAQNGKILKKNEVLFKEGDNSECMYVVKTGRLSVFKSKGSNEIELAEIGPGQMIGEMAFFDGKPRSASVKAISDSEVLELPFKALKAQFDTFPEWVKAIIKTINEHLRDANKKIKNLEQGQSGINYRDGVKAKGTGLPPHQANKLCAILMLVAHKWGTAVPEGIDVKPGQLRKFTIQVFQEATNKMQTLMTLLQGLGILKQEDLGEGKQRITLLQPALLDGFVEWFNEYLYTEEEKRVNVEESEMKILRALLHFSKRSQPDDKGKTKINLIEIQNESMKELGYLVGLNDYNSIIKKGIASEKVSEKDVTFVTIDQAQLEKIYPYWQIFFGIQADA